MEVVSCRNQKDVTNPCQHENRQRIVDHRFIVDRQKLLVDGERSRIKPRPGTAGENDAFHAIVPWVSKRSTVSASASRHGRSLNPNARVIAAQFSLLSSGRVAGVDSPPCRSEEPLASGERPFRQIDDLAGELEPARLPRAREMVEAIGHAVRCRRAAPRDLKTGACNVAGSRRAAALVRNDVQAFPLAAKPQDRFDEIPAVRAVDP